jgi:uncharacterized membrane protein
MECFGRWLSGSDSVDLLYGAHHVSREERMKRIVHTILWGVLTVLATANGIFALRYLFPHVPLAATIANFKLHRFTLALHASSAGVALLVGPFQIAEWFRIRRRRVHRALGWIYVVAVALGAVSAVVLAPGATFGPIAGFGFFTLAIVWLIATGTALKMAIRQRFENHRRWMLRSYALTAAAITLRILMPAAAVMGLPTGPSYRAIAWMCWLVNLGMVEVYLAFRPVSASQLPGTNLADAR